MRDTFPFSAISSAVGLLSVQQQDDGRADISLTGRWRAPEEASQPRVWVRLVTEDRNEAVATHLEWAKGTTRTDGTWSAKLRDVPTGGLYRLETCLQVDGCQIEWARHGEMRHHIGVGDNWLIAGQSNSVGYGKSPAYDPPELGIHMFAADGRWKLATHPLGDFTGTIYQANSEAANASHSPWIAFARRLRSETGYPIGLIPAALGGSAIRAWDRSVDGHLFSNMLGYLGDAGSGVRGVVWYQGESDVQLESRSQYRERFTNVLKDLRRVTGRCMECRWRGASRSAVALDV